MAKQPRNRAAQDLTRINKRVIDRRLDVLERQLRALLRGVAEAKRVQPMSPKR